MALVKDSGKSKFELPKKTTTTTNKNSGVTVSSGRVASNSSQINKTTSANTNTSKNPTYSSNQLITSASVVNGPVKNLPTSKVNDFRQYLSPQYNNSKYETKSDSTIKPSGTRPDSNESGMPNAIGTSNNNSSGTSSSANYSASVSGNASNVNGDLMSMYEQQQNRLAEQLQAQQAYYEQQLRAQQEARQQAAQNAYNSNMSALENAYAKRLAGLDSNLASTKDLLTSSYNNSRDSLNASAEKSLQEAYINRMMNERNLRQQLNAQGLNGGASESAIASMLNNYGTSRNNINTATADSLRSLEEAYNNNIANAQQKYNDAVGDAADTNLAYKMQLENDLANGVASSYSDLYSALGNMDSNYANSMTNLINNQSAASADLQQALYNTMLKNSLNPSNVTVSGSTSSNAGSTSNIVNRLKQMKQNGASLNQLLNEVSDYSDDQVAQMFAQAGIPY